MSTTTFDADRPWRLHERVALRPEPFGALAYHYGNRRLTFLRSPDLVDVVEGLADAPSARAAFTAARLDERRWPSFDAALTSLANGDFIVPEPREAPIASAAPVTVANASRAPTTAATPPAPAATTTPAPASPPTSAEDFS